MNRISWCVLLVLAACGCSTVENCHRQKNDLMNAYVVGNQTVAQTELAEKLKAPAWYNSSRVGTGDELVWRLEAGTLAFAFGRYADAIREFGESERLIAEYDSRATVSARDVGSEAAGALSNLNALPYRGWCRDRMGLEIYKSLAYLGEGREDAFRAQVKRLRERQKEIQQDYEKFFEAEKAEIEKSRASNPDAAKQADEQGTEAALSGNAKNAQFATSLAEMRTIAHKGYGGFLNPLALYLSALGNIRDGNWDNASIDTGRLYEALPANPLVAAIHSTVLRTSGKPLPASLANVAPLPYPMDRDCVYVIAANGRGAAFDQMAIYWPVMVAWPKFTTFPEAFRNLEISASGQNTTTVPVADMDAILAQEFDERLPGIITRPLLSTLIKDSAYRTAQYAAWHGSNDTYAKIGALLAVTVVGSTYRYAMNTADTRCWEMLPKEYQLAQLPMPADRKLTITPAGGAHAPINVTIPDSARSAIVYVHAPNPGFCTCSVLPFNSK